MSKRLLPLIPAGLVVDQVDLEPDQIIIRTHPRATAASCPGCGGTSARPHSRYTRTMADLPWQDRRVVIAVRTRRWRCPQPYWPRRVFAERLAGVAQAGARRTHRLGDLQHHLGLALGGKAGARLAGRLGLPVSPDARHVLVMVKDDHVQVGFPYDAEAVALLRAVPGARFMRYLRAWSIPIAKVRDLHGVIGQMEETLARASAVAAASGE